jgi:hypothetical protein
MCTKIQLQAFSIRDEVVHAGDYGNEMIIVLAGEVVVYHVNEKRCEQKPYLKRNMLPLLCSWQLFFVDVPSLSWQVLRFHRKIEKRSVVSRLQTALKVLPRACDRVGRFG